MDEERAKQIPPPLYIRVSTIILETGQVESVRWMNHYSKEDRVWLGRHCYWAFRNGRSILTEPGEPKTK